MNKNFSKKDIKNGDVIKHRNGIISIAIPDVNCLKSNDGYDLFNRYTDDLTNHGPGGSEFDIVEVYRPKEASHCSFNEFSYRKGVLMYKREDFEEMTVADIEKALGKKIKIVKEK